VGARHANPDFVVHFGDACLSDEAFPNIEIEYVFPKLSLDLEDLSQRMESLEQSKELHKSILV